MNKVNLKKRLNNFIDTSYDVYKDKVIKFRLEYYDLNGLVNSLCVENTPEPEYIRYTLEDDLNGKVFILKNGPNKNDKFMVYHSNDYGMRLILIDDSLHPFTMGVSRGYLMKNFNNLDNTPAGKKNDLPL